MQKISDVVKGKARLLWATTEILGQDPDLRSVWGSFCMDFGVRTVCFARSSKSWIYALDVTHACVCLQALESHLQFAMWFSMFLFDSASQTCFISSTDDILFITSLRQIFLNADRRELRRIPGGVWTLGYGFAQSDKLLEKIAYEPQRLHEISRLRLGDGALLVFFEKRSRGFPGPNPHRDFSVPKFHPVSFCSGSGFAAEVPFQLRRKSLGHAGEYPFTFRSIT